MKTIGFALLILGAAFGAFFSFEGRYTQLHDHQALAADFKAQKKMNDYQFLEIQWKGLKNAIWDLKQKYIGKQMDQPASKLLQEWETEKELVKEKMKVLEGGK